MKGATDGPYSRKSDTREEARDWSEEVKSVMRNRKHRMMASTPGIRYAATSNT